MLLSAKKETKQWRSLISDVLKRHVTQKSRRVSINRFSYLCIHSHDDNRQNIVFTQIQLFSVDQYHCIILCVFSLECILISKKKSFLYFIGIKSRCNILKYLTATELSLPLYADIRDTSEFMEVEENVRDNIAVILKRFTLKWIMSNILFLKS